MNKRQKAILLNFITVIIITTVAVAGMIHFRNWVNHSEAMRAMENLGRLILKYRQQQGSVPSESRVNNIRENLEGNVRLGNLRYRGLWVDFESDPNVILAYTERNYNSWFLDDGFIVLRLNGRVDWMGKREFQTLLAQQQSPVEIEMQQK